MTLAPLGFPCGSAGKESTSNVGDLGSIPGLGRTPGEGKAYPLQYSGLKNSMDCIVHAVAKSWTRLSHFHFQGIVGFKCPNQGLNPCPLLVKEWSPNCWTTRLKYFLLCYFVKQVANHLLPLCCLQTQSTILCFYLSDLIP